MAKTKAELLKEAKKLELDVSAKMTIAQIQDAIKEADKGVTTESKTTVENSESKKSDKKPAAKAGRRSEKGQKEAQEKAEKIERQKGVDTDKEEEPKKPKKIVKPARPRVERRAKGYRKSAEQIDKNKQYSTNDAVGLAIKSSYVKFDATVELHIRLNVDPKQADQNLRDSVVLPAGTGKSVKIAVFAEDDDAKKAMTAGATIAGESDVIALLDKNDLDFDILIASPNLMIKLAKYAKILGPKGLMPNPKSGTVTNDVKKAVEQAKAGKIEYRVDSTGIIHVSVGKVSFGNEKILKNVQAVFDSVKSNKPSSVKGVFVKTIAITTSMGPSIKIQPSEL